MRFIALLTGVSLSIASVAADADQKDERGGTCNDAKQQWDYYCNGKGDPNDIFTQANIACNNAKRNMAAACEGKSEQDYSYEFNQAGTPPK
ncbi:MAG: hypothetical protein FJY37_13790 [Betaproteobacteria bacterium]|nr:hypothetical protein [Betaproteobacteria bacterium]